ncbi:HAMP domain-containing histidine kinase [Brevibacillus humidisoli]|uniref:sensor histidine kinase n=1 Tax=Brevibacillus humidisoli TaxID=2895522 RepID=UPI001E39034B|nr:HAMP domain-containing sensor histidine kinase [Brevibacillus humidisoli]UFJ40857.1 HAMP domain-containing histidine kinase [Brevibacillus humidisoli]
MSTKDEHRISLLQFWTTRYLLILCVGLLVIGIISTYWIKHSVTEKRLGMMKLIAEELADRIVDDEYGRIRIAPTLPRLIASRERFLEPDSKIIVFVISQNRQILFKPKGFPPHVSLPPSLFVPPNEESAVETITGMNDDTLHLVKRKIVSNGATIGWVALLLHEEDLTQNKEQMQFLIIMLGSLGLLGWGVIYLLTRKLSRPIKEVADAAKQIVSGNYDVALQPDVKELELYELIDSFKEMADRLRQLEMMRTELLAGVTHELKTPVTSISGLIQAVQDGIVTGEEAKEFLQICTKETNRLQKMVEDLLDFNSLAVGEITVRKERQNMNQLVQEIVYQWTIGHEENRFTLRTHLPDETISADTDPMRIQQILYNLLNNAKQAIGEEGTIDVFLRQQDDYIQVDVQDNGSGIPEQEQHLIFERFFRGAEKKHRVRGLGLGLPFSKMIAKALGGDLLLTKSTPGKGSIFTLLVAK